MILSNNIDGFWSIYFPNQEKGRTVETVKYMLQRQRQWWISVGRVLLMLKQQEV
jgi:hypothetical protein